MLCKRWYVLTSQNDHLKDALLREVQASDAKARLPQLLSEVERGETIVITRHGRAIARIVPEAEQRVRHLTRTMEQIAAFRKTMPSMTASDLLAARHEGHRR